MIIQGQNCKRCPEFINNNCDGNVNDCMCKKCPRNLGKCLVTKYCSETESIIEL